MFMTYRSIKIHTLKKKALIKRECTYDPTARMRQRIVQVYVLIYIYIYVKHVKHIETYKTY